jgi:myo-inositol 2-dehydrogenase / D-chiro-inositol 1-dehydrogenase
MIRAGILGAGYIAAEHARGYAAHPEVRLTAIASRQMERAQALAAPYGAQAFLDHQAMLAAVDVVSICTPTPTHADLAIAALRAGKHVLCEKPIARTIAQAEAMLRVADDTPAKLMIAHVSRYEVDHRKAKEVLDRGDLGQLCMASQSLCGPAPEWSADNWMMDPAQSGGPILDLAIHSFDYLLWLFGERVTRVYASGDERYAQVSLRFENGGLGLVETSWAHPRAHGLSVRTELVGTRGRLSWDYDGIASMQMVTDRTSRTQLLMVGEDSFITQAAEFIRCIQDAGPVPISGAAGLAALRVALAALESLRTGRAIDPQTVN